MSTNPKSINSAISLDLEVPRGDDITWNMFVVKTQDDVAVDITGATITFSVKEKTSDTTALITRIVGSGIVIDPDQVNNKGKYQLSLVPSNTTGLGIGPYEFDIEMVLDAKLQTIARGNFEILDDITRP